MIDHMNEAVSHCLGREIDGAVWQYFAGLPEYWEDDICELLAELFKYAEPEIESILAEISADNVRGREV
jgi:hypothetical protein